MQLPGFCHTSVLIVGICSTVIVVVSSLECAAPAPCTCDILGPTVWCNGKNLTAIPQFHETDILYDRIDLSYNNIARAEENAFANVSLKEFVSIYLDNNEINHVDEFAFTGLENSSLDLNFVNNNLKTTPTALIKLTRAFTLTINGIELLEPTMFKSLGVFLQNLDIGMEALPQWLEAMKHLDHLKQLSLRWAPELQANAFRGFKDSLEYLNIYNTNFMHSPEAICDLGGLKVVYFNAINVSLSDIIPTCQRPIGTVDKLTIEHMDMANFPNIFVLFPNVSTVIIRFSKLRHIDDNVVPSQTEIVTLDLTHNELSRVPHAIRKMTSLRKLSLEYNAITSIEAYDVGNMPNSLEIYFDHNPMQSISEFAFSNNSTFSILSLSDTMVTTVPKALLHLPEVRHIYLDGAKTECNCYLFWLTQWDRLHQVNFYGNCYNSMEAISSFIEKGLHLCNVIPVG